MAEITTLVYWLGKETQRGQISSGGDTVFQKAVVEAARATVRLYHGHAHSIQGSVLPFPPCGFWGIKLRSPGLRASTFTC